MRKGVLALIVIVLVIGGLYYIAGPSKVLDRNIEVSGIGVVKESFQVTGLRNLMYVKVIIEGLSIFNGLNISIIDPDGGLVFSKQGHYGENTYYLNATITLSKAGKYTLVIAFLGDLKIGIMINSYNQLFSFLLAKE